MSSLRPWKEESSYLRGLLPRFTPIGYFKSKGSTKAIADTPAVQLETASSSTELARRSEAAITSTELARRPEPLERLMVPPSSFGSANSNASHTFYPSKPESPKAIENQRPTTRTVPEGQSLDSEWARIAASLWEQLHQVVAVNTDLNSAATDLQMSVSKLEIQVSDL